MIHMHNSTCAEAYALNGEYEEVIEPLFSHRCVPVVMSDVTWRPKSSENSLQLRCRFGSMGLESKRSL